MIVTSLSDSKKISSVLKGCRNPIVYSYSVPDGASNYRTTGSTSAANGSVPKTQMTVESIASL